MTLGVGSVIPGEEPIVRKGMILRVIGGSFSWLVERDQTTNEFGYSLNMVQIPKWSHLTVLEDIFFESGSVFARYPVLFEQRLLCLVEPSINFHINHQYLKVVEDVPRAHPITSVFSPS